MGIKALLKYTTLIISFLACLVVFSFTMRVSNYDYKGTMPEASLPIVNVWYGDVAMGLLHGYTQEMDLMTMRAGILPVAEDRNIRLTIDTYGRVIDKLEYQIRDLDQSSYIGNDTFEFDDASQSEETLEVTFRCANILEEGEQYSLEIMLYTGNEVLCYYCRLLENGYEHLDEVVDFAWNFHESSFDASRLAELSVYIEPNGEDNDNLGYVSIHSSLSQIGWGALSPEVVGKAVMTLSEVTDFYDVINIDYTVLIADEEGALSYYNVDEYYRVRFGVDVDRCYLLNYERRMNEIAGTGSGMRWASGGLYLGINSEELEYIESASERRVCFATQGDIWSYDLDSNLLTLVYSFRGFSGVDPRENYGGHIAKPLRINNDGGVQFAVYGYMNRGVHEGEVGIGVYAYDALTSMNTEQIFIPETRFEDVLIADINDIVYLNEKNKLYLHINQSIYEIDLNTYRYDRISQSADVFQTFFSRDALELVWQEETGGDVYLLDLEKERVMEFACGEDEQAQLQGFLDVDFVYTLTKDDTAYMENGHKPATAVNIIGCSEKEIIKQYSKKNIYVTEVTISEYTVDMKRAELTDEGYVETSDDALVNEEGNALYSTRLKWIGGGAKQLVRILTLNENRESVDMTEVSASEEILETLPVYRIVDEAGEEYAIYSKGVCDRVTADISEAIRYADANTGLIVNDTNVVWGRGRDSAYGPYEAENIEITLRARHDYELSGVELNQALIFLARGYLVVAQTPTREYILSGYDASNVWIYDRMTMKSEKYNLKEMQKIFGEAGNRFQIIKLLEIGG